MATEQDMLKKKLKCYSLISNPTRFKILASLLTSKTLGTGSSHTFTDLQRVLKVSSPDLNYHLKTLTKSNMIYRKPSSENKKEVLYDLTMDGYNLLKNVGITEKLIRKIDKK